LCLSEAIYPHEDHLQAQEQRLLLAALNGRTQASTASAKNEDMQPSDSKIWASALASPPIAPLIFLVTTTFRDIIKYPSLYADNYQ
jgi:hypothetical protein